MYQHDNIVPEQGSKLNKKVQVEQMFDDIAPKYDLINRVLSAGIDISWRKKILKKLAHIKNGSFLDIATGTGDLAIMLTQLAPKKVTGIDISRQMLDVGIQKIEAKKLSGLIEMVKADSENLPYEPNTFDAATVAFGVRNFQNLDKGLAEIYRVLKPEATFIILEFSKVKTFPIKQLYNFYFRYITPTIGKLFSKNAAAYTYLPNSVAAFPEGLQMCNILQQIGFKNPTCTPLTFGIATIYQCTK
jgi:demethylmenaquinone methyltransferase / 2-methoxy-6-polyprenyl-1,4-benzoquinol methylase